MSHLFWRSRYCKRGIVLVALLLLPTGGMSSDKDSRGLFGSLENLLEKHKKQYDKLFSESQKNSEFLRNTKGISSVSLHPEFLRSLLLYTSNGYLKFAAKDECRLLSLIDSGLAKTARERASDLLVEIVPEDGNAQSAIVSKENYLDYVYTKKCFGNKEIPALFSKKSIAQTIKSIKMAVPQSEKECRTILADWLKNPYIPYLCAIPDAIERGGAAAARLGSNPPKNFRQARQMRKTYLGGKFLKKAVPFFNRNYLTALCSALDQPKNFCGQYLSRDVWSKVVAGEQPSYKMDYRCRDILGKTELSEKDIKSCAKKFNGSPKICTTPSKKDFPHLFPTPNCKALSDALIASRLHTDYRDCPGNIDNQSVVNIHRIIAHKKKSRFPLDKKNCSFQANYSFAKLNLESKHEKGWPLTICYFDKISDEKKCYPYVPNFSGNDPLSETRIIAKILYRTAVSLEEKLCKIVEQAEFNPSRLQYKSGCFIVYNSLDCILSRCPKKILYDLKEVKGIEYVGFPSSEYFATSFGNEKFSANNMLLESLKLEKKTIHNLTFLKTLFKSFPRAIAHGVGCAEDMLPSFFKRNSFSGCRPLPFTIDGIVEKKGSAHLSFRSAIDDVHSPRLIPWNYVFSGISNYQELHPLNTWTFYGIK